VHSHSYENEFNLHANENSFSFERMGTKTRFEKEAKGNSEMAYCPGLEPGPLDLDFSVTNQEDHSAAESGLIENSVRRLE